MGTVSESSEPQRSGIAATTDAVWLILPGYVSQILMVGLALLLRRVLGPAGMGYVAVTGLATSYASYLSLGAMQAAEREIPIAIAHRDEAEARALESAGVAVALVVSAAVCGALLVIGASRSGSDALLGAALICGSTVMLLQQISNWATVRLRTRLRFSALGRWTAAAAVSGSILTVVGALVDGAAGALVGVFAGGALQAAVLWRVAGLGGLEVPSRASIRRLAALSPAFFASGVSATLLLTVDQLAVGFMLGTVSLGLYSAAYLGNGFALRVPTLVGTVIYPRLQRELGITSDPARVFAMTARTTGAIAVGIPLLVAAFFVGLPALVFVVLPEFRGAIWPMRLLLVGVAGIAFGMPGSHYLITVNRQWQQVAISLSVLGFMAGAYLAAGANGMMSLQVAAGVDVVAYFAYGIAMQEAARRVASQPAGPLLRLMPIYLLPAIELLAGAAVADALVPRLDAIGVVLHAGLQGGLFGLTWASLAGLRLRAHQESREDLSMVLALVRQAARRISSTLGRHWE